MTSYNYICSYLNVHVICFRFNGSTTMLTRRENFQVLQIVLIYTVHFHGKFYLSFNEVIHSTAERRDF